MDKTALEALVRQVLLERLGGGTHGVKAVQVPRIAVTEEHRMDTGNPLDRGRLKRIDEVERVLVMEDKTTVPLDDIISIDECRSPDFTSDL